MDQPDIDARELFDEDYLYFYAEALGDERSDAETELLWRLLELEPGMEVLDLACGHGRIANRLAVRGCRVTGLDATPLFLDRARQDAADRGVEVDYLEGDMRNLPWTGRFDRVVNWFTAFGYFDDAGNRRVLTEVARALKPGGRFALELQHRDWIVGALQIAVVAERDGDLLIDRNRFEPLTGRIVSERTVVRGGRVRRLRFFVRLFGFTELRDWLLEAGFATVDCYGQDGAPLSPASRRLLVVARR
ncbi:MAG TPA: class I SAM-dependent methyltransferase [Actinomycetota bacterium]|nr:class I SAM-dependent methyltransferase [Actinomycetota bacterium]